MLLHYTQLSHHPRVFEALTGLQVPAFDELLAGLQERRGTGTQAHACFPASRTKVRGQPHALSPRDQLLLVLVWLRRRPTHEVLGFLFGVSDSTASRVISRLLPFVRKVRRIALPSPIAGRRSRRGLDDLLIEIPDLAFLLDD